MDSKRIGYAAGLVWDYLREHSRKGVTIAGLKRLGELKADEAVAAIGWLAREGKLEFEDNSGRVVVRLAESECVGV